MGESSQLSSTGSGAVATGGGLAAGAGGIAVAGNVEGDIIIGDNNFKVNNNYGTVIFKEAPARVKARDVVPQAPRAPRGFVDRSDEVSQLTRLIAAREAVTVSGPDGAGKSTLFKHAARSDAARSMPGGVLIIEGVDERGEVLGLEDVTQRMFDALFESEPPLKVNITTARTYLSNTQPLVILDGLNLPAAAISKVVDLFPNGALLIEATRAPSGDATETMKLGPLPRSEAVTLLAARLALTLDQVNRSTLDAICNLLSDMPLAIVTAANAIHENDLSLDSALATIASAQPQSSDALKSGIERAWALAASTLSDNERQLMAVAAHSPALSVDVDWIKSMMDGADWVDDALERAQAMGMLTANSPRLRLHAGFRNLARPGIDETVIKERLMAYLLDALGTQSLDWDFCADELGNIMSMIEWAAAQRRWHDLIALVRAIDPYLTLHGLWGNWRGALDRVLQAAQALGDRVNEGWALHQLGTHAIGVGQTSQAADFLRRALDVRRALSDDVGMAYTQHNLNLLVPPAPPEPTEPDVPRPKPKPRGGGGGVLRFFMLAILVSVVAIVVYLVLSQPPTFQPPPEPQGPEEPSQPSPAPPVLEPQLSIEPLSGPIGTEYTIRLENFRSGEVVKISLVFNETGDVVYETTVTMNGQGFNTTDVRTESGDADGIYLVVAEGLNGSFAVGEFAVEEPRQPPPPSAPFPIDPPDGTQFDVNCNEIEVNLIWTPVEDASGGARYIVELEESPDGQSWGGFDRAEIDDNSWTFRVLCKTNYRWHVFAVDEFGQFSEASPRSHFSIFKIID